MNRRIPYAVANYEQIVRDNFYFVDKTRFIHELEKYQIPVMLRPRRFGKSLWCSILECYYDVNRKDRFEELFGNTDIGRKPTDAHNSHLVMRLDLSQVEVKPDLAFIERSFNHVVNAAISVFSDKYANLGDFSTTGEKATASEALISILRVAARPGTPPLHIIIDEYDNFTNQLLTTHQDSLYSELTTGDSFLGTFFKVIKAGIGEGTVARVFVTGVLPVTMDDLTSGFNIGQIITLKEHTLEMMGFTQAEMDRYLDEIFADYGWPDAIKQRVRDDLRSHYNGYRLLPTATETLYNELAHLLATPAYSDIFSRFLKDRDLAVLFDGYWQAYVKKIPAQAFDKANENFFRTTFFELCTRYLPRYFRFAIEVNRASGRSDWEAIGRDKTPFENQAAIIEFKHYPRAKADQLGVAGWTAPPTDAVEQVTAYAADLKRDYPELTISRHVVCTIGAADYRFFTVSQG